MTHGGAVMLCVQCQTVLGSPGDEVDVHLLPEAVGQAAGLDATGPVFFCAHEADACRSAWIVEHVPAVIRILRGRETSARLDSHGETIVPPPCVRLGL